MIRQATITDLSCIMKLGIDALTDDRFVVDTQKVGAIATECIERGFAWVSVDDGGEVVAAVCALVSPMPLYYGNQILVVQFKATRAGAGIPLLREWVRWCEARPDVRRYSITLHPKADPRIGKLLQRLGLNESAPFYAKVKV